MVVGSVGSSATRVTFRPGRFRVMSVKVNPAATSALVDTKTCPPTATATLLALAGATSMPLAGPGSGKWFGQVAPPSVLCQRFCLLLAYTTFPVLGAPATAA